MNKKSVKIFILQIVFCIMGNSLYAHTIITKDLKVLYGNVSSTEGQFITFNSDKGPKKIRKDLVGKIIIQDIKDETFLKKLLKKVKEANPGYLAPSESSPPPSTYIEDIVFENAKNLLLEIEEEEKAQALKEKSSAAIRKSLIFPGYGQYYLENKKTGIFYGSIFILSLGGLAYSQNLVNQSYAEYKDTVSQNVRLAYTLYNPFLTDTKSIEFYTYSLLQQQASYKEFQDAGQMRNALAIVPITIYALQFLHTYWNVRSFVGEKKVDVKLGFAPMRENNFYESKTSSWGGIINVTFQF
ncbi:MAG: DUF5683 domain-containing protein [Leptospiraceae bacterium]|nr:DUF5683 domain-containing protein [Leptospiraceae bacterium]